MTLNRTDPLAIEVTRVVKGGDLDALQRLLAAHPGLAAARLQDDRGSGVVLHSVTDWPGFFPNGPAITKMLLDAGADPDAKTGGGGAPETPLHWTASNDDVDVAEALILGGADIELNGGSIAGGTALENAIGYGCSRVARLLLLHGAKIEKLWHAAALGMTSVVEGYFRADSSPSNIELNNAFWHACSGGHRRTAEFLLARGADLNWIPDYAGETPLEIGSKGGMDTGRQALVDWLRAKSAKGESK